MFTHIRVSTSRIPITRSVRPTSRRVAGVVAFALLLGVLAHPAQAQEKGHRHSGAEMRLNLVDANPWVIAIHPEAAGRLRRCLQAKERRLLGIGVADFPPVFPGQTRDRIFIVFDDPDHCPSFIALGLPARDVYDAYYCDGSPDPAYPELHPARLGARNHNTRRQSLYWIPTQPTLIRNAWLGKRTKPGWKSRRAQQPGGSGSRLRGRRTRRERRCLECQ